MKPRQPVLAVPSDSEQRCQFRQRTSKFVLSVDIEAGDYVPTSLCQSNFYCDDYYYHYDDGQLLGDESAVCEWYAATVNNTD